MLSGKCKFTLAIFTWSCIFESEILFFKLMFAEKNFGLLVFGTAIYITRMAMPQSLFIISLQTLGSSRKAALSQTGFHTESNKGSLKGVSGCA